MIRIGILGAGKIAKKVTATIVQLDGMQVTAVGARDRERAEEFAKLYNIPHAYSSYDELAACPEVDLIYITTPHTFHAEHARLCLNAGKHVMVEKPFSYNRKTAEEIFELAKDKNLFCCEAMWLLFNPIMKTLKERVDNGVIGKIRYITVNLGYDLRHVERLTNPDLAGGALLDVGIYPINAVLYLLGEPKSVVSFCDKTDMGMDSFEVIDLRFATGAGAHIMSTMLYEPDKRMIIYGESGRIEIDNVNNPYRIDIYDHNEIIETLIPDEIQISGYDYEFIEAVKALEAGRIECEDMPVSRTLMILDICDRLRSDWGIRYPFE